MRVVSVVGARPQFVKAAPLSKALRQKHEEILVHTGQHYDWELSEVFFAELQLPTPNHSLGVGSASHGAQTARMLEGLERVLLDEQPDCVVVYGDTNSTLAGALAAVKLGIPVAHVEAGPRYHDLRMPEEVNRVVADHLAALLFCPTASCLENLRREGLGERAHLTGDVMLDALRMAECAAASRAAVLDRLGVQPDRYLLLTLHRPANVDAPVTLRQILEALRRAGETVVFPVHPRTRRAVEAAGLTGWLGEWREARITEPLGFLEFLALERGARKIVTDSGGVQREAFFLGRPCVTVYATTPWVETTEHGWNVVAGTDPHMILAALHRPAPEGPRGEAFGNGRASERIVQILSEAFGQAPAGSSKR